MEQNHANDIVELEQLLTRYATAMTRDDIDSVIEVFTPDGTYRAFGTIYSLSDFPRLAAAGPKGLFLTGTPELDLQGDTGTGRQTLCFVDQTNHEMRTGWYTDTYVRAESGWRLKARAMTFLRLNGARDSGKTHEPMRPLPSRRLADSTFDGT
jgi:hypothetical protein